MKAEVASLKEKLKKQAPLLVQAQSKAKKEADRADKAAKELSEMKDKAQKQASQNIRLKSKVTSLEQQLSVAATAAAMPSFRTGAGNQESMLELERSRMKAENLEKEVKFLTGKINEAGKWGQTLIEQNEALRKQLKQLQTESGSTSNAKVNFNESMRTLEDMVKSLELENQELRSNMGKAGTSKRPLLVRGITEALANNDELCSQLSRVEAENRDLRNHIEILEGTVARLSGGPTGAWDGDGRSGNSGKKTMDVKTAFQRVFGGVQKSRLARMLGEEEDRARELQIELQHVKHEKNAQDNDIRSMNKQFVEMAAYAHKQEQEASAAQIRAQLLQLKLDTAVTNMTQLKVSDNDDNASMEHRVKQLHGVNEMANSMLQELRAGVDDSLIDDINFLTADSDEESEDDYDARIKELEGEDAEGGAVSTAQGGGAARSSATRAAARREGGEAEDASVEAGSGDRKSTKKSKSSVGLTRQEKQVVNLTLNETHKKLMQAFKLIELLTNTNAKYEAEIENLEKRSMKKIKQLQFVGSIIVVVVPIAFCIMFLLFVILKVNC